MQILTKEAFGPWDETVHPSEYETGRYPIIFVSDTDDISKIVIDESDFSKYIHTNKQEDHEICKDNGNLPWVRNYPSYVVEVSLEE